MLPTDSRLNVIVIVSSGKLGREYIACAGRYFVLARFATVVPAGLNYERATLSALQPRTAKDFFDAAEPGFRAECAT